MITHVTAALGVLRFVADRPDPTAPIGVGAIAAGLGVALSGASRLCAELEGLDLLEHAGAYGAYRIGARAIRLSGRAAAPSTRAVRLALIRAAQQTGETVCLAAGPGETMTVTAAVVSAWTLHAPAAVGELVRDERSAILHAWRDGVARTVRGGRTPCAESVIGMTVELAAPIRDPSGECVAVIAVRMPRNRVRSGAARARRSIVAAGRDIERAIAEHVAPPHDAGPHEAAALTDAGPDDARPRALDAAARILDHLAPHADTLAGTARAVGLRLDRTRRVVDSCRAAGLIEIGQSGELRLTWAVHGWHRAAAAALMVERGAPIVADTAARTGQCAFLTVLRGMRSVTIVEELVEPGEGLRLAAWLGRPCPIVGADGGPTLLMDFPLDEIPPLLSGRATPEEVDELRERTERVAADGVLTKESFEEAGQISISAPVRDASGAVAAAACIVGATDTIRPQRRELEAAVLRLAAQVSDLLRCPPTTAQIVAVAV